MSNIKTIIIKINKNPTYDSCKSTTAIPIQVLFHLIGSSIKINLLHLSNSGLFGRRKQQDLF